MTIRITGMNSGLDTEAIITELASARSVKVQKIEKEQTKLSWKIDAWKELNTKIYSLYSDVISDMRFDYAYAKKITTASNPDAVTVLTAGDAMNGVQTMKVTQMAKTGYLTGASIEASSAEKLLANMEGLDWLKDSSKSVSFKVTVGGEEKEIKLTGYNTLNDVVEKFKEIGLEAKFDTATNRFFITSKETGAAANFTMSPSIRGIPEGLQEVREWSELSESEKAEWQKKWEDSTKQEADAEAMYNAYRDGVIQANNEIIKKNAEANKGLGLLEVPDEQTVPPLWSDLDAAEQQDWIDDEWKNLDADKKAELQKKWGELTDKSGYAGIEQFAYETIRSEAEAANKERDNIIAANNKIIAEEASSTTEFTSVLKALGLLTAGMAEEYGVELEADKAANMIEGQDAIIELNGAKFTSATNTFEINGLTLTVHKETKDEEITLTTEQDTSGIYDLIKNFIQKYSELINEMDKLYNADSASSYEPLTREEKDALSDSEIEDWENKIKESLLRRDTTLSSVASALKTVMLQTSIPGKDGTNITLSYFGIETLGYFKAKDNEKSAYHIDGDPDDSDVKNNEDKLKKAIATEPDTVIEFFQQLAKSLYSTLEDKMARTDYSSAFTVYNDKLYDTELKEYSTKIATEQEKLNDYIDRWYEKFSQMEVALGKLSSKESSLSSLFG